jgi:broad specificity phosphatase PhoE
MPNMILVRHSLPEIVPSIPANEWRLSEEGRQRCLPLAKNLTPYQPQLVISSEEPKARETAELIATELGLPFQTASGLHEHLRKYVPYVNKEHFEKSVAGFFDRPNKLVFGEETAIQARDRFSAAVEGLMTQDSDRSKIVVAHGTVMTLYITEKTGFDPYPFWQQLALPSFVVLTWPENKLVYRSA